MTSSQTLGIGFLLDQKFRVVKELGHGAFGATYLVEHVHFGTRHVVKEYLPDSAVRMGNTIAPKSQSDSQLFQWGLKRFFDEANLLYRLNHPNVVKVTDLFQAHGTAYFVMPYLGSETLEHWIKKNPNPTEENLLSVFIPLLEGLKYIHKQGLLHRDIKPGNILISQDGTPILIDFGSARNAIGKKSKLITRVLTPHFAPIEQYSTTTELGESLDLYSLAASMYQAITNDLIPAAPDRITNDPILLLSQTDPYRSMYSSQFLMTIDKNLSFSAAHRDQTAAEMQNHLLGYNESQEGRSSVSLVVDSEEDKLWQEAVRNNTIEAYQYYLSVYPIGRYATDAHDIIKNLIGRQEQEMWTDARQRNDAESYKKYLEVYPQGEYATEAELYLSNLTGNQPAEEDSRQASDRSSVANEPVTESSSDVSAQDHQSQYASKSLLSMDRMSRKQYIANYFSVLGLFYAIQGLLMLLASMIDLGQIIVLLFALIYLTVIGFSFAFAVRRMHDAGKSGFFILIPIYSWYLLLFVPSDTGKNKYGNPPDPDAKVWHCYAIGLIGILCASLFMTMFGGMGYGIGYIGY